MVVHQSLHSDPRSDPNMDREEDRVDTLFMESYETQTPRSSPPESLT